MGSEPNWVVRGGIAASEQLQDGTEEHHAPRLTHTPTGSDPHYKQLFAKTTARTWIRVLPLPNPANPTYMWVLSHEKQSPDIEARFIAS